MFDAKARRVEAHVIIALAEWTGFGYRCLSGPLHIEKRACMYVCHFKQDLHGRLAWHMLWATYCVSIYIYYIGEERRDKKKRQDMHTAHKKNEEEGEK